MKTLSAKQIQGIFETFVQINNTPEYLNRYSRLPLYENRKKWRWEGKDFPRVIAVLEFKRMVRKYGLKSRKLLTFNSPNDPELEYLKYSRRYNYNYEDDKENYDLHSLNIPRENYDFVMLNQTIEHLYNPFSCVENIFNYLSPGGYIYANVPAVNIAHSTPFHFYTGLTPTGLACLFGSCGFKIVEVGQWGNTEYINLMYKTGGWPDYKSLTLFDNEFDNPAITWILAIKS